MKDLVIKTLTKKTKLSTKEIENLIEIPPAKELGDYSFPTFTLAKTLKKNPNEIAKELAGKIPKTGFEKIEAKGPYVNFFLDKTKLAKITLTKILKEKSKYGAGKKKNKTIVMEFSSPNIAKPFGIGHLRSTIIGNSISNMASFLGYKTQKINYLGDWGTPFGKILAGYEKWGNEKKLKENPVKHLYEIYVKASSNPEFDEIGRSYFKKMEKEDKNLLKIWKNFRDLSIKDFKKIYELLEVKFDTFSGESVYRKKMEPIIKELEKKKLLERSENALIIDLKKYDLGVGLIQKTDGSTLYLTRDIAAAKDRYGKYKFHKMFYEVGSEQALHFKQLFKTLELMGYDWAKDCEHINHGLYLDKDGKKFATREGKTIFMEDILNETIELAKKELKKRENLKEKELNSRALAIARAAIVYGDLKNHRTNNVVFDIRNFLSFEGDTGPYLLYTYARARSILRKAKYKPKPIKVSEVDNQEKNLIFQLASFPSIVEKAYQSLTPNTIANYAFTLSKTFSEFYHSHKVINSKNEAFRLSLVDAFSQVLKNALLLLQITPLEEM